MRLCSLAIWCFLLPTPQAQDHAVVATVGRFAITGQDLIDSYEFGPAFVRRYPNPLRKHLEYMIYERLLALEAEQLGYDTTAFVRERVTALEEDLTVDELYKDDVLSRIKLTDREIEEGIKKERMNLRIRWLYAPTLGQTQNVERELKRGVPFDSLYARTRERRDSLSEHLLELSLLSLECNTPGLARGVADLKTGQVSSPIEGPDGYYLVRLDRVWQNPIVSETEYASLKDGVVKILTSSRADELAGEYVKSKMVTANPVIKAEGFNIVRAYIAEKGLARDTRVQWDIPSTFMTEAGPQPINSSGEFLSRPLVTFADRTLTVRDYVTWFDVRQFQLKTRSLAAFNSSIKRTIWKLVQDKLLSSEAYGRRLNRRDKVKRETGKWNAKLLYLAGRSSVLRGITIDDQDLKKEYERMKGRYKDASGRQMTFAEARDQVWSTRYYQEEERVLSQTLRRLKDKYPVNVDEEAVSRLAVGTKSESNPVDVVFYKPGGTFPRVAFPTIDESWQRLP